MGIEGRYLTYFVTTESESFGRRNICIKWSVDYVLSNTASAALDADVPVYPGDIVLVPKADVGMCWATPTVRAALRS